MELLLGAGSSREKKVSLPESPDWNKLVTLDINEDHAPDVVHDLTKFPYPFEDDTFDEVHAYEVLEHTGRQGDYEFFFKQWEELWRILKPDGFFCGTCPDLTSRWVWGDPGHTRVIAPESFIFLNQPQYEMQVGKTPMTDYRFIYKADFEPLHLETQGETFVFVLKAMKPSRYVNGKTA